MNNKYIYKIYCKFHYLAKVLLRRKVVYRFRMVNIDSHFFNDKDEILIDIPYINDLKLIKPQLIKKEHVFPVENLVDSKSNLHLSNSYRRRSSENISFGVNVYNCQYFWRSFIDSSIIPSGYRNSGFHFGGYILDKINEWCLPSWIWTNAAIVRMYCMSGELLKAESLVKLFLDNQLDCGGWIVRNDYISDGVVPVLAPNDSAYIANNAFLVLYKETEKLEYLEAAKKCGDWIMETARPDSLVWTGFDMKKKKWIKNHIIVDTGFTAGLFANLYDFTGDKKYKNFLEKFIISFIDLFFDFSKGGFATSLDQNNNHFGGFFSRGQAWALEGLIPAYRVLKSEKIREIILITINNLINQQLKNGGWPYNFSKPLLGIDCKGVAVIAKNLMDWHQIETNEKIFKSAERALQWCRENTALNGDGKGGIFSFCMEGAVVHNFYSKTAFVYTSAYAIELHRALER